MGELVASSCLKKYFSRSDLAQARAAGKAKMGGF